MTGEDDAKLALLRETLEANVDLTTYETEVYLALVRGGTQTMTEIAETSDVPKQRVYDIVDDLRSRSFVEVIDDYPRKAYAVDPSEALSSVREQLSQAEEYLEELHETVETVESGIALFKSESTIHRYVTDLLDAADRDVLLLVPVETLPSIADDLERCADQQVRLILSNVPRTSQSVDALDVSIPNTVDEVRAVSTEEDFALTVDRRRGLYWAQDHREFDDGEAHGYYVTNPSLAMVLDRFVSESIWPLATPIKGDVRPSLPEEYMRIRDCLADVATLTESRQIESLEIAFEGYDTDTGEAVSKRGTLTGYYYREYDVRASLTLDVEAATDDVESSLLTVGGVGARDVDYAADSIQLRDADEMPTDRLNAETERHLEACRAELPTEFGTESVAVGVDAFIDRMRELVERRPGGEYERIRQFDAFREALVRFEASESVPRVQWRQTRTEPGGHVAHVGGVFDKLGYDVALIGQLGDPIRSEFAREFQRQQLVSLGRTTSTDFVWFEGRKFLLTEPNPDPLDWDRITDRIELSDLAEYLDGTAVLTLGSWFATPRLPDVLDGLRTELWPLLNSPPAHVHVAPGEVSHFSPAELEAGCPSFDALDDTVPVTMTANRSQTRQFRDKFLEDAPSGDPTVARVRERFGISQYVMHSPRGATLADADDVIAARAPRVVNPRRTRNVDEHFNSGMALALAEGLSDGAALVLANSVASYFLRHKKPPEPPELRSFVGEYDEFFDES